MQELQKISLESLMRAGREEHNLEFSDSSNGYRPRRTIGHGRILELRVPRSRKGHFYPMISGLLRDQEEECRKLAFNLYGARLTTEQVGNIFGEIYGKEYSSSQISRILSCSKDKNTEDPLDKDYTGTLRFEYSRSFPAVTVIIDMDV